MKRKSLRSQRFNTPKSYCYTNEIITPKEKIKEKTRKQTSLLQGTNDGLSLYFSRTITQTSFFFSLVYHCGTLKNQSRQVGKSLLIPLGWEESSKLKRKMSSDWGPQTWMIQVTPTSNTRNTLCTWNTNQLPMTIYIFFFFIDKKWIKTRINIDYSILIPCMISKLSSFRGLL